VSSAAVVAVVAALAVISAVAAVAVVSAVDVVAIRRSLFRYNSFLNSFLRIALNGGINEGFWSGIFGELTSLINDDDIVNDDRCKIHIKNRRILNGPKPIDIVLDNERLPVQIDEKVDVLHIFIDIVLDTRDLLLLSLLKIAARIDGYHNIHNILSITSLHNGVDIVTIIAKADNKVLLFHGHFACGLLADCLLTACLRTACWLAGLLACGLLAGLLACWLAGLLTACGLAERRCVGWLRWQKIRYISNQFL